MLLLVSVKARATTQPQILSVLNLCSLYCVCTNTEKERQGEEEEMEEREGKGGKVREERTAIDIDGERSFYS